MSGFPSSHISDLPENLLGTVRRVFADGKLLPSDCFVMGKSNKN
jgi:hypothetical protein